MRGDGDETFEVYSLQLLRRAIAHDDQDAWAGFQQCLEETVLTWLHEHPGKEAACLGPSWTHCGPSPGQEKSRGLCQARQASHAWKTRLTATRSGRSSKPCCPARVSSDWPTCSTTVGWVLERFCIAIHGSGVMSRKFIVCGARSSSGSYVMPIPSAADSIAKKLL